MLRHRSRSRGKGVGSFTPASLPNLAIWLDASDPSTFTYSTGADISQWRDKSGKGNHFVQATAGNQPLVAPAVFGALPAVRFYDDSTAKFMTCADNATLAYTAYESFAVVLRDTDLATDEHIFGQYDPSGNQRVQRGRFNAGDAIVASQTTDGTSGTIVDATTSNTVAAGASGIVNHYWNGTPLRSALDNNIVSGGSGSIASIHAGTSAFSIAALPTGANPLSGYIAEVLFFTGALTEAQRFAVLVYLSVKWGVAIVNPATYNPLTNADLKLWLDATDTSTLPAFGSDVSQWLDKTANANNAVQATGSLQPLYVASGIGGKASVQFYDDSTAKYLAALDAASFDFTLFTILSVIRRVSDLGATETIAGKYSWASPANQREFRIAANGSNERFFVPNSINGSTDTAQFAGVDTLAVGSDYIVQAWFNGTNINSRIANTNVTAGGATGGAIFQGTSPFFVGSRDGGNEPFAGYIGEIRFWTAQLSANELASNIQQLATKWGIAL